MYLKSDEKTALGDERKQSKYPIIKLAIFIYMLWIPLMQVWNVPALGLPLYSVYFSAMSCIICLRILAYGMEKRRLLYSLLLLVAFVAWLSSVLKDFSPGVSLFNDFLYVTPLLFYILSEFAEFDLDKLCKGVQIMTIIGGIVSALVYFGYIDSGLNYRISIAVVDNAIGLIGLAVSIYLLLCGKSIFFSCFSIVMSVVILGTGQSRARIILGIVIVVLSIIYALFVKKGGKIKSYFTVFCIAVVVSVFVYNYFDTITNYLGFLIGKFEILGEDSSFTYRLEEMKVHIELFIENPLVGIGCGALNAEYLTRIDTFLYGHNMFTSALALNGIFFFAVFITIYLKIVVRAVKAFFRKFTPENFLALLLMAVMTVLSITSSGFGKPATHIMILVVGVLLNKKSEEN